MTSSFRIAEISFSHVHGEPSYRFRYEGNEFEVHRYGANFDARTVRELVKRFRNEVDAFALISLPPVIRVSSQTYAHRDYLDIMGIPSSVPLCDGSGLREISNLNALMRLVDRGALDVQKGMFFPVAFHSIEIAEYIRKRENARVFFGDAYALFGFPRILSPFTGLKTLSKLAMGFAGFRNLNDIHRIGVQRLRHIDETDIARHADEFQYVIGDMPLLATLAKSKRLLQGKDLITWSSHPGYETTLLGAQPRSILNLMPEQIHGLNPYMNFSLFEAVLRLSHRKTAPLSLEEWAELFALKNEVLPSVRRFVSTHRPSVQVRFTDGVRKLRQKVRKEEPPDFAFVLHALAHQDFERVPGVKQALQILPDGAQDGFDRLISKAPPIVYGHVKNVISDANGKEINGILYGLFATPKVLKETPPEVTYAKIEKICYDAAARGAKIIGLGAYTKVIGDSGVTINKNSPIPVTTGNSLSASATLWGLYEAVEKMGILGKKADTAMFEGTAMVVGATGSIGSVSSKLLSLSFSRLYLIAPRLERLNELASEIRRMSPNCEVIVATDGNLFVPQVDVLVTATSAFDQKVIDVMQLKPGCIVCDCSRPLDFSLEDAKKRPDVLIIESGEVLLPGPYEVDCNLGLPGKTVYACLAETALLALEGRHESFTLGRDIDWLKVKEIYKMAKRHGVRLSSIEGHMGTISDREIELIRQLARSRSGR